jgi:hypothetical protein
MGMITNFYLKIVSEFFSIIMNNFHIKSNNYVEDLVK